jgi:hypothetical protein
VIIFVCQVGVKLRRPCRLFQLYRAVSYLLTITCGLDTPWHRRVIGSIPIRSTIPFNFASFSSPQADLESKRLIRAKEFLQFDGRDFSYAPTSALDPVRRTGPHPEVQLAASSADRPESVSPFSTE